MVSESGSGPRLTIVQLLRAVAALGVTAVHFNLIYLWLRGDLTTPPALAALAAGVDLFFVISGFIMVYASESLFAVDGASWTFLRRRLARIAPLYWLVTFASLPILVPVFSTEGLLKSLSFIPFAGPSGTVPVLGVGWTLNFEMFFYTVFSATLVFSRTKAVAVCASLMLLSVGLGVVLQPSAAPLRVWSDPIVLEFVAGMLIALAYRRGVTLPLPLRLAMIVAGCSAIWLFAPPMMPTGLRALQWGLPMALLVASAVLCSAVKFNTKFALIADTLGDASYSLYLVHGLVAGMAFRIKGAGYFQSTELWQYLTVAALVAVVLSVLVHLYVERPTTRWLQKRLTLGMTNRVVAVH